MTCRFALTATSPPLSASATNAVDDGQLSPSPTNDPGTGQLPTSSAHALPNRDDEQVTAAATNAPDAPDAEQVTASPTNVVGDELVTPPTKQLSPPAFSRASDAARRPLRRSYGFDRGQPVVMILPLRQIQRPAEPAW